MAYTKIIAIRNNLNRCVNYALNKDKTDLKNAVFYAFNQEKTNAVHIAYESSINCLKRTAIQDMIATKKKYSKTDGVQGYHIIQSFKPGEVDAKLAHQIGYEFANACFGDRYEIVIATHLDRNHLHNHIIFNSVSCKDGCKLRGNFNDYFNTIRGTSDALCEKYGLSVISPDIENRSLTYNEWLSLYKGKASWNSIIKSDIDHAISKAPSYGAFLVLMEHQGYAIKEGKYLGFKPLGKERFSRGYKLGKGYSRQEVKRRIEDQTLTVPQILPIFTLRQKRTYVKLPLPTALRIYWRYMFMLGKVKKHQAPPKMSAYLKEELLKFEQYKAQFKFMIDHDFETKSDVESFIQSRKETITPLTVKLNKINQTKTANQKTYIALKDYISFAKAFELYQDGYTMMAEESDRYLRAKDRLAKNGFTNESSINHLLDEHIDLISQIDSTKKLLSVARSDVKKCEKILAASQHIEEKIEKTQIEKPEKGKEYYVQH